MLATINRPSFPPIDDAAAFISRVDWAAIAQRCLAAALVVAAVVHALALRLWAHRGRLAPMLRRLAAALTALADRLPEPLTAASPRAALVAALADAGQDPAALAKASRPALITKARRLALIN